VENKTLNVLSEVMFWMGKFSKDATSSKYGVETYPTNQAVDSREVLLKLHCYFKLVKLLGSTIKDLL